MSKVKDKIEIIIADNHMMIREGLKQLLELDGTMKVIAEANAVSYTHLEPTRQEAISVSVLWL